MSQQLWMTKPESSHPLRDDTSKSKGLWWKEGSHFGQTWHFYDWTKSVYCKTFARKTSPILKRNLTFTFTCIHKVIKYDLVFPNFTSLSSIGTVKEKAKMSNTYWWGLQTSMLEIDDWNNAIKCLKLRFSFPGCRPAGIVICISQIWL